MNNPVRDDAVEPVTSTSNDPVSLARLIAQSAGVASVDASGNSVGVPQPESKSNRIKHVVFVLDGTHYALPLTNVLEIQRIPRITSLPHVPSWLRGVTNMRGDVLSVVDLRMLLGIETADRSNDERMVVVKSTSEDLAIGWIVDRVVGIRGIEPNETQPCSTTKASPDAGFIQGIVQRDDRVIAVLDVNRVLNSPILRQFELAS